MTQLSKQKNDLVHYTAVFLVLVIALNIFYLVWVVPQLNGKIGMLFYSAEFGLFSLTLLFATCHFNRYEVPEQKPNGKEHKPSVDVFIPCYTEPLAMIERTVRAATRMTYKNKHIYVLDDSNREEVKNIAKRHRVQYLSRTNNKDAKAGNLNNGLKHSYSEFILVLDADQVAEPTLIECVLPYFKNDPQIAFVTTKQRFDVHHKDFNRDNLFYDHMQVGKNKDQCPISTGSGVIYRRHALIKIGGFITWNLVEDLTTSYILHQNGFKSVYVNQSFTTGLAPQDVKNIYKQRGTWAVDTLRLFWHKNPFLAKGLTFKQRLHYFEMCYAYIVSGIFIPMLFFFPAFSLLTNISVIHAGWEYLLIRTPGLLAIILFYDNMSKGHESNQMWVSLWPIYFKSIFIAMKKQKIGYKVTQKVEKPESRIRFVIPQLIMLSFGLFAIPFNIILYGASASTLINSLWIALELWWIYPILHKGFSKSYRHVPTLHSDVGEQYS